MRSLLDSLNDHPMALLRGIAALRGISLTTNSRSDAAAQLAAILAEPSATREALAGCSPAGRAAWHALQAAGGLMKVPAFKRAHGAIRPIGPGRLEREAIWQSPQNAAEELWYRGLIFRAFADRGDGPVEYVHIPDDILPAEAATESSGDETLAPQQHPAAIQHARNTSTIDACALLAITRTLPIRVDNSGEVRAAEIQRLEESFVLRDPVRTRLLITLARERDWLAEDRGKLVVRAGSVGAWLRGTHWEQMSSLFTTWVDSTDLAPSGTGWNDLRNVPGLRAEGNWRNDPLLARRAILQALTQLAPEEWYALSDLVASIKASNPDFQRPDGNYTGWYLRDAETEEYLSGFESWENVEGRLIRFLITGPLFWLGAVALGNDGAEAGERFRLTPSGAAWLAQRGEDARGTIPPALPKPASLAVDEDFVITAPLLLPLRDRFRLLRFTEMQPVPYEPGQPTRHRITRSSLARARDEGIKGEAILEFLHRATAGRLPDRVIAGLKRWDLHGGSVRITRGAVLRVADTSTLAVLRADPVIAPLLGDLISAQAVLVSNANLSRLLRALEELGYAAKVD